MKKLFTLSLLAIFTSQISFAQDLEPGFYPPEGSTFNEDSSVVTLPSAYLDAYYSDTIVFYVSETFSVDLGGETADLPFNFAEITSVTTPNGMDYSCNPANCYFEPNTSGQVILSGVPTDLGIHQLDLTAFVSINATPLGLNMDLEFTIPYTGGEPLLDFALAGDYSILNDVVPTFLIEVIPFVGVEEVDGLSYLVVAPNPASTHANFSFYNTNAQNLNLQVFDLLGNIVYSKNIEGQSISEQTFTLNTSSFKNGVYVYTLSSNENKLVGRLLINK